MAMDTATWAKMSAEERRAFSAEQKAKALAAVNTGAFPTGIKVTIAGKEYIARPVRQTDSGGVSYSITPRAISVGKYSARFNKLSVTLLGEGSMEGEEFESEELL